MKNIYTISSLDVAKMLEMEHKYLLRKLEGRKDRKGYIQILDESQMEPVDFFIKNTYVDQKGEIRPCYQFTKLGCDFIANKFTGEKGVLFTAKYVKKFHEMTQQLLLAPKLENLGGLTSLVNITRKIMKDQNSSPTKIAEQTKLLYDTYNVPSVVEFVEPSYEQMKLTVTTTQMTLS